MSLAQACDGKKNGKGSDNVHKLRSPLIKVSVSCMAAHDRQLASRPSLQNRREFLRISGEQRRKRGEREASAKREWRARGGALALLPSRATRASRSPRARLVFASVRLKYAKIHACSAGYSRPDLNTEVQST